MSAGPAMAGGTWGPAGPERKQMVTAEGLIRHTAAKPLARGYWTLSISTDDTALRQFMRTPPHVQVMTSLKPFMGPTRFVTWTASAADGRPSMAAAVEPAPAREVSAGVVWGG
jgi:hypothetical protein